VVSREHLGCHFHGHQLAELNVCYFGAGHNGPDEGVLLPASGEDDHLDQLPWPEGLDYFLERRCHLGTTSCHPGPASPCWMPRSRESFSTSLFRRSFLALSVNTWWTSCSIWSFWTSILLRRPAMYSRVSTQVIGCGGFSVEKIAGLMLFLSIMCFSAEVWLLPHAQLVGSYQAPFA